MFSCRFFVLFVMNCLTLCSSSVGFYWNSFIYNLHASHTLENRVYHFYLLLPHLYCSEKNLQGCALNMLKGWVKCPHGSCTAILVWQALLWSHNKYYVCKINLHLQIIFWSRHTLSLPWGWTAEVCWLCWESGLLKLMLINRKNKDSSFIGNTEQKRVTGEKQIGVHSTWC